MFFLLKGLSFWRIILLVIVWFFIVQPLVFGTYSRIMVFYWWMRP